MKSLLLATTLTLATLTGCTSTGDLDAYDADIPTHAGYSDSAGGDKD